MTIQTSSPNPFGQSKPKYMWNIHRSGGGGGEGYLGHMTKTGSLKGNHRNRKIFEEGSCQMLLHFI